MNEEISHAAEQLPEYRQQLLADCATFAEVGANQVVNDYVMNEILRFSQQLRAEYPDISFKQVLEYQALIGGSETDEFVGDADRLREVLERITQFVAEGLETKATLLK